SGNHLDLYAAVTGRSLVEAAIELCERLDREIPWMLEEAQLRSLADFLLGLASLLGGDGFLGFTLLLPVPLCFFEVANNRGSYCMTPPKVAILCRVFGASRWAKSMMCRALGTPCRAIKVAAWPRALAVGEAWPP